LLESIVGLACKLFGIPFNWVLSFKQAGIIFGISLLFGFLYGLGGGLIVVMVVGLGGGLISGLLFGLIGGLESNLLAHLNSGLSGTINSISDVLSQGLSAELEGNLFYRGIDRDLFAGFDSGIFGGVIAGLIGGLAAGLGYERIYGFCGGLVIGLPIAMVGDIAIHSGGIFIALSRDEGFNQSENFIIAYFITCTLIFFRPFYLFPYLRRYFASKKNAALSFKLFQHSPLFWDEVIAMPLPNLSEWLIRLVNQDRKLGFAEVNFVSETSIFQRNASQKALLSIASQDLQKIESLDGLSRAKDIIEFLPSAYRTYFDFERAVLSDIKRQIKAVSNLAEDYNNRETISGRLETLENLDEKINIFRTSLAFSSVGAKIFLPSIEKWSDFIKIEKAKRYKELTSTPIPNPYIVGKPLDSTEKNQQLFMGRRDIIAAIEENIVNPQERNALLLYGRRRIGKTSTLKNLGRFFQSKYLTVYVDFQNGKWRDSDTAFCYNLVKAILEELERNELLKESYELQIERFKKNTFTSLDEWLDKIEKISKISGKQILLTFDEYEKLEEDFENSKITKDVFNQLRSIVQHREQIVILFSGGHRFEEMSKINWSDYLINTKTLELGFLSNDDANRLLTDPVPKLSYNKGIKENIIKLTHCQPYLLQSFGSDLVNHLNYKKRFTATQEDFETIVEKVLISAQSYFYSIWSEDMSEEEQEIMRILARGRIKSINSLPSKSAVKNLVRKEVVEEINGNYQLKIELFRKYLLKNKL
jgi:hypothetical protein